MFNVENNQVCGIICINEKNYLVFRCNHCNHAIDSFDALATHLTIHYDEVRVTKSVELMEEETYLEFSELNESQSRCEEMPLKLQFIEEEDTIIEECTEPEHSCEEINTTFLNTDNSEQFDFSQNNDTPTACDAITLQKDAHLLEHNITSPRKRKSHSKEEMSTEYKCKMCGYAYKNKYILRKHMLRHSGRKEFSCSQCPKMFYTRTEVKLHERHHSGERPYLCTFCGKTFVTTSNMFEHMKRHKNVRPYKCEVCGKSFYERAHLRDHMPSHSDERLFPCPKCSAAFKLRRILRAHMQIHLNKREHRCHLCDASFNQRPALKSHLKSKHGTEIKIKV